jgi:hypothetical protein
MPPRRCPRYPTVFLAWRYREVYRPMLAARVRLGDTTPESPKKSRSVGDHATA